MSAPRRGLVDDLRMSLDHRVRLTETPPPSDLPADVQNVWRKLAPLVDRSGVVVLPRHIEFGYRSLCQAVALYRRIRAASRDLAEGFLREVPWLRIFGLSARQVAQVF